MSVRTIEERLKNGSKKIIDVCNMDKDTLSEVIKAAMETYSLQHQDFILTVRDKEDDPNVIHEFLILYGNAPRVIPEVINGMFNYDLKKNVVKDFQISGEFQEGAEGISYVPETAKALAEMITELGMKDKMAERHPDLETEAKDAKECAKVFTGKGIMGITRALQLYQKTGRSAQISKVILGAFLNQYETVDKALSMISSCDGEFEKLEKKYKGAYAGYREAYSILHAMYSKQVTEAGKEINQPEQDGEER